MQAFLPATLLVYYALPRRGRHLWLTLASYFFYGWANPAFMGLMFLSTAIDFVCGRRIGASPVEAIRPRRAWLIVSIVTNLALLGFFAAAVGMWASLAGDRWGPALTVFWASLCAQISLAYVVLSAVLVAASLMAGVGWWWGADRRTSRNRRNGSAPSDRVENRGPVAGDDADTDTNTNTDATGQRGGARRVRTLLASFGAGTRPRALLVAVGTTVALWALPAWEQFVAPDGAALLAVLQRGYG